MATASAYKPSPLSFGSPRTSPFRRPESPATQFRRPESPSSPSAAIRPTTPTLSPTKVALPRSPSPSKLQDASTPTFETPEWKPRTINCLTASREVSPSPTRSSSTVIAPATNQTYVNGRQAPFSSDAISKIPASQVRELREGFQILDRDNDGLVNRDDVVDMLTNLGQHSNASDVTPYFPPGAPQTLPLPTFLNNIADLMAQLSEQQELLNAFAAFDEDDGGEIDVAELRDALLNTAPEAGNKGLSGREVDEVLGAFTGRRAFGKELGGIGQRQEVFRYREWVGSIIGSGEQKKGGDN